MVPDAGRAGQQVPGGALLEERGSRWNGPARPGSADGGAPLTNWRPRRPGVGLERRGESPEPDSPAEKPVQERARWSSCGAAVLLLCASKPASFSEVTRVTQTNPG